MAYNFLLGNLDKHGELEGDMLDPDARNNLQNLATLMGSSLGLEDKSGGQESIQTCSTYNKDAVDYGDIEELASEHSGNSTPRSEISIVEEMESSEEEEDSVETPLSAMLPEEYKQVKIKTIFPQFKKGKVLRLNKLFGEGKPRSLPMIWKGAKSRRRPAGADEPSTSEGLTTRPRTRLQLKMAKAPALQECVTDDEEKQKKPEPRAKSGTNRNAEKTEELLDPDDAVAAWRFGPAQFWYDYYGVAEDAKSFDYGVKLSKKAAAAVATIHEDILPNLDDREDLLPFNTQQWEDEIIWDVDLSRDKVVNELSSGKQPMCGWIPTQHSRTYDSFMAILRSGNFAALFPRNPDPNSKPSIPMDVASQDTQPSLTNSIFPVDNHDFDDIPWENDIIWDTENMTHIPTPQLLTLDLWDDPKLMGLPDDKHDDESGGKGNDPKPFDRKEHQFTKKSQQILGQVQKRQKEVEEEMETSMSKVTTKDPFNMSNDEFYLPKGTTQNLPGVGASMIQHSIPAQNIMQPFFPTYLNAQKLRYLYRATLKKINKGPMSRHNFHGIHSLTRFIRDREMEREEQRQALGGGDIFLMREPEDLSARDGELVLCEFSEEHPPLMQQPGMASRIRNYSKRKQGKENVETLFEYGETAFTHASPFLGVLPPGDAIQAIENNLYRAPLYKHSVPLTDFLIIRNKTGFYLRELGTIFTVGQECPLYEVPSPNSKRTTNFARDFLLAFIYRLFWVSDDNPKRLKMEDIKKAFPHLAESSVRKRLKQCADFRRMGTGTDNNFWVLRGDFRLPSREEVTSMISAEMCCAHYSMQAAEQRLKDAGYGEKYFFTPAEDDDSEQVTMEDEIKCAPWNSTRAFIMAMRNKCLLDLTGGADPTGCGEGFSYVRVSSKPPKQPKAPKEETKSQEKKLVTGTDADLRKLSLKDAKQHLREFGVQEDEINSLTRWEIIDVIRTISTQQAKAAGDNPSTNKFARGNIRYNLGEMKERYADECQRIFELQNKMLASDEILSTEEESSGEDSEIEEMGKNIESMLTGNAKSRAKAAFAEEEKERQDLHKMLRGESNETDSKKKTSTPNVTNSTATPGGAPNKNKKLKISRTLKNSEGHSFITTEIVTRPELIDAYMKVKTTKDAAFIRAFAQMDEEYKEEVRKKKRRLQDQYRRLKRNEIKAKTQGPPKAEVRKKTPPPIKESILKMKCSACNGTGHMKTNKNCPLYGKIPKAQTHNIAPTDEDLDREMNTKLPQGELVRVEGTKVCLNRALVQHEEDKKKRALMLKFPKALIEKTLPVLSKGHGGKLRLGRAESPPTKKPKQCQGSMASTSVTSDYEGPKQSVQRRRADPRVTLALQLESIVNELRNMPQAAHFLVPVNKKQVPDYYRIVEKPTDLQKLRSDVSRNVYETREAFLSDVKLIFDNSRLYNGDTNPITNNAKLVFEAACKAITQREFKIMRLEKAINPLLDDNDIVAFSFILENILASCKNLPKSHAFHQRVDQKKVKTYYEKITIPMDLGTMERKLKKHQYTTAESFVKDLDQIYVNSQIFNGVASLYTLKALEIKKLADDMIKQQEEHIFELEKNIQKALDSAEVDSFMTGPSSLAGDAQHLNEDEDTIPFAPDKHQHLPSSQMPIDFSSLLCSKLETLPQNSHTFGDLLDSSAMARGGQIHADLAMSDSDDDVDADVTPPPEQIDTL